MSERDAIPAEIWDRFAVDTTLDLANARIIAKDGSYIDINSNSVVLADGRRWNDVRLFAATRH